MSNRQQHSPVPPPMHSRPSSSHRTGQTDGIEAYNTMAETVAGPSLRVKDNVIQAAIIIGCMAIGAIIGLMVNGWLGMGIGAVVAMIISTLISGGVLMVLGWVRALKKAR